MSEEATPVVDTSAPVVDTSTPPEPSTTVIEQSTPTIEQNTGAWYQTLPEDTAKLLNDKDKQYKTMEDYIKSTHELRGKLSEKGIIPPGENATKEERDAFLEQIQPFIPSNVPESYEIEALKDLEIPDEQRDAMFSEFKDIGLSNDQASKILEFYGKEMAKDIESVQAQREAMVAESEKQLKQEFGTEYEARMERAATILDKLGNGFGEFASEMGLFTKPEFIKILDKIGSAEAVLPSGTVMTAKDIQGRIAEIKSDPKFMRGSFEERRKLAEEMRSLISMKNQ